MTGCVMDQVTYCNMDVSRAARASEAFPWQILVEVLYIHIYTRFFLWSWCRIGWQSQPSIPIRRMQTRMTRSRSGSFKAEKSMPSPWQDPWSPTACCQHSQYEIQSLPGTAVKWEFTVRLTLPRTSKFAPLSSEESWGNAWKWEAQSIKHEILFIATCVRPRITVWFRRNQVGFTTAEVT